MIDVREKLDQFLPSRGQCWICGVPGMDARHRIINAVEEHHEAGEPDEVIADELGLSGVTVHAILAWCAQNPYADQRGPWLDGDPS